ncbi:hypothetical protein [Chitinophaga arvensicola]|uniref:Uncharacterized protein n=1 Tax=Chitinophaga arvensicola TaxID=29529 RepID=A0A1I0S5C1_9BACT|nr:hypothetical protein [Chitinophaga arvensicola]SEW49841.1 hypothetical protein SAMN04488122_3604 [Chitinophaga arvensicola]
MRLNLIYNNTLPTDQTIVTGSLSAIDECVLLMSSGEVVRHKFNTADNETLFSVISSIGYTDGGFDITASSRIFTLDEIVVVVNDYKRHGFIHYPGKYTALHLWREDYHADISSYPIAMFRDAQLVPHIIYAVAWNHVQIMNLDTRQVLTAAKSLIEEFAEEWHLAHFKKYDDANKAPWPSPYDYFYGGLQMSPDNRQFMSTGWAWGSYDLYNIYEVDHFIRSNRIADKIIDSWEHNNRAACWVNNHTVAVAFHPVRDEEEGASPDAPCEIHLYKTGDGKPEIAQKIKVTGMDILNANLHYSKSLNAFIAYGNDIGVALISPGGDMLFHDADKKVSGYHAGDDLLLCLTGNTIQVYRFEV